MRSHQGLRQPHIVFETVFSGGRAQLTTTVLFPEMSTRTALALSSDLSGLGASKS